MTKVTFLLVFMTTHNFCIHLVFWYAETSVVSNMSSTCALHRLYIARHVPHMAILDFVRWPIVTEVSSNRASAILKSSSSTFVRLSFAHLLWPSNNRSRNWFRNRPCAEVQEQVPVAISATSNFSVMANIFPIVKFDFQAI